MREIETFGRLNQKLQRLAEEANDLPPRVLLTETFLRRHTPFASLTELVVESGRTTLEESLGMPKIDLDHFIATRTSFGTWEEMRSKAATEYLLERSRRPRRA
jgi:hypothetical protein